MPGLFKLIMLDILKKSVSRREKTVCETTQTKQKINPDRFSSDRTAKKNLEISTKTKKWEDSETMKELCFVVFVTNPKGPNTKDNKMLHFHINWFFI